MKLPLLVAANPRVSEGGPVVKLHAGRWKISTEGVVDSELSFSGDTIIEVDTSQDVKVSFKKRGKENHVSCYAELL